MKNDEIIKLGHWNQHSNAMIFNVDGQKIQYLNCYRISKEKAVKFTFYEYNRRLSDRNTLST